MSTTVVHRISTKNRTPWLRDAGLRTELYAYMATIVRDNIDSPALLINGVADHIHALIRLSRRFAVMKVVQEVKTETSKWLKRQLPAGSDFAWQAGYGAFSVNAPFVEDVKQYIQNQQQHQRRVVPPGRKSLATFSRSHTRHLTCNVRCHFTDRASMFAKP